MNGYYASSAVKISHTNNDDSKNPFNYSLIIGMSIWSLHDGTNRRETLVTINRRMRPCVTLCHSLCIAARSPVVFLGNGFIPLMRLDYTTICSQYYWYPGPLLATGGHKSPNWQETPRLSWFEDNYICQCMVINVWLIMRPEDVISIFRCRPP